MRLLVLGGTQFLGRGVVDAALAAGDTVTTFTRGVSGAPPAGVEALHGDRTDPAAWQVLRGREWDAVVDTSGYVPRPVGGLARLLADAVGHYVFVSTMNVYPAFGDEPLTEASPLFDCPPDAEATTDDPLAEYGKLKAGCERAIEAAFPGRATHVRAGLILGPYENVGRLPWWITRIRRGGEVLAPGDPNQSVRFVDARDLGAWCVTAGRDRIAGAFNATGPADQVTLGGLFEEARRATGSAATFTWVSEDFLVERKVRGWVELPLWLPATEAPAVWQQDTTAVERAGLHCRPVADTVADTAGWLAAGGKPPHRPDRPEPGLGPDREVELLAAWKAR